MTDQVHRAAQYVATTAIHFLTKKDDDSHTNMDFSTENGYLETWPLNVKGNKIAFAYATFSLHWLLNTKTQQSISLDGKTHKEVVRWIRGVTTTLDAKTPYRFQLHYALPYPEITDDFVFRKPAHETLRQLVKVRTIAQNALEHIVKEMQLSTAIRIWPHHFDTGGFVVVNPIKSSSIGFGMAIPDAIVDDFYLYTSGYMEGEGRDTSSFDPLSTGQWKNGAFKGAVLGMENVTEEKAIAFLKEAISAYHKKHL